MARHRPCSSTEMGWLKARPHTGSRMGESVGIDFWGKASITQALFSGTKMVKKAPSQLAKTAFLWAFGVIGMKRGNHFEENDYGCGE